MVCDFIQFRSPLLASSSQHHMPFWGERAALQQTLIYSVATQTKRNMHARLYGSIDVIDTRQSRQICRAQQQTLSYNINPQILHLAAK